MNLAFPALALAAAMALTASAPADAAPKHHAHKHQASAHQPLRGVIYGNRRIGGYSYHYSDVMTSGDRNNPAVTGLYPGGSLDSDFFYTTPHGPFGGTTPYMH